MFSQRATWNLTPNRLAVALAERRQLSDRLVDLTESNPTRCGFSHPGLAALEALALPGGLRYEPSPRGLGSAREAVARYYADAGVAVDPERVILTASTSEAYGWLFKLLADHGQEALAPRPSYPLFDFLAGLEGVRLGHYPLEQHDDGWSVDLGGLERAIGPATRAIVLVSPNNPTGSWVRTGELAALDALAAASGLAILSDEVFRDFTFGDEPAPPPPAAVAARQALTFSLSGLSKVCGLPQLKLGWIVVGGPEALVKGALERLEVIADTYLSVATPVQLALPHLLAGRHAFLTACQARVRANRDALARLVALHPAIRLLRADGGWYACIRVPRLGGEEEFVLALLREDGIHAHPGYFFDFPGEAYLVVSLIVPPEDFTPAAARLLDRASG